MIRKMDEAAALTRKNSRLVFTIAFNYGGRAEIVDAVKGLMDAGVDPDKVTEKMLARHLYDDDMPDVDLMIRTSGEFRTSNFLLWQLAYSEMLFTDELWPDFTRQSLRNAVAEYQSRSRRYGGVTA